MKQSRKKKNKGGRYVYGKWILSSFLFSMLSLFEVRFLE